MKPFTRTTRTSEHLYSTYEPNFCFKIAPSFRITFARYQMQCRERASWLIFLVSLPCWDTFFKTQPDTLTLSRASQRRLLKGLKVGNSGVHVFFSNIILLIHFKTFRMKKTVSEITCVKQVKKTWQTSFDQFNICIIRLNVCSSQYFQILS